MRWSILRRAALTCALAFAVATPASLRAAETPMDLGIWYNFFWSDGLGPIDDPADGFSLFLLESAYLRVVDFGVTGDAFDVFISGVLALATPSTVDGIVTGAFDGDAAWAHSDLSKGKILLGPGTYTIDISVREHATGFTAGQAAIRADVVPEPATMLMLGTGLMGLAGVARRRRRRDSDTVDA